MATYILLLTLTPEGRAKALNEPDYLLKVESAISIPGVQTLGLYAVLGQYDFVTLVEASSNADIARFSIEVGVRAGVHVTTLPVIPASHLATGEASREATIEIDVEAAQVMEGIQVPKSGSSLRGERREVG